jgi:hypothetical protein
MALWRSGESRPAGLRPETVFWMCGGIYIAALVLFYLLGAGHLAGYLTWPGGILSFGLVDVLPESLVPFFFTTPGNIALLVSGAFINVFSSYLILRLVMIQMFGERPAGE